jgi:hypothetical protein
MQCSDSRGVMYHRSGGSKQSTTSRQENPNAFVAERLILRIGQLCERGGDREAVVIQWNMILIIVSVSRCRL